MRVSAFTHLLILAFLCVLAIHFGTVSGARTRGNIETEISLIKTYLELKNEYEQKLNQIVKPDFHSETTMLSQNEYSTMFVNSTAESTPASENTNQGTTDLRKIMEGFGYSFVFIFMSEIGDKTFIFVMLYASKMNGFLLWFVASLVLWSMHVVGVYLGNIFMMVLGEYWLQIISIVTFFIFGIKMIYEAWTEEDEDIDTKIKEVEDEMMHKDSTDVKEETGFFKKLANFFFFNNAVNVGVIILCAEMGDRSQISAVALSAFYEFWVVAVAGWVGHILAVMIAILFWCYCFKVCYWEVHKLYWRNTFPNIQCIFSIKSILLWKWLSIK